MSSEVAIKSGCGIGWPRLISADDGSCDPDGDQRGGERRRRQRTGQRTGLKQAINDGTQMTFSVTGTSFSNRMIDWFLLSLPEFYCDDHCDQTLRQDIATTIATRRCDDHCDKTMRQDIATRRCDNNYDKTMWQYDDQLIFLCSPEILLRQLSRRQIATILPTQIATKSRQQDATMTVTKQCDEIMRPKLRL